MWPLATLPLDCWEPAPRTWFLVRIVCPLSLFLYQSRATPLVLYPVMYCSRLRLLSYVFTDHKLLITCRLPVQVVMNERNIPRSRTHGDY